MSVPLRLCHDRAEAPAGKHPLAAAIEVPAEQGFARTAAPPGFPGPAPRGSGPPAFLGKNRSLPDTLRRPWPSTALTAPHGKHGNMRVKRSALRHSRSITRQRPDAERYWTCLKGISEQYGNAPAITEGHGRDGRFQAVGFTPPVPASPAHRTGPTAIHVPADPRGRALGAAPPRRSEPPPRGPRRRPAIGQEAIGEGPGGDPGIVPPHPGRAAHARVRAHRRGAARSVGR